MLPSDLAALIEQYHQALDAFMKGDAEPMKALYTRRDDVTLANPFGPPVRGWDQVAPTMTRAATHYREGEVTGFELVSAYATSELAYTVELEHRRTKVGDAADLAPLAIRATTIFRREESGWRIVHRHADSITAPCPPQSVVP